MPSCRLHHTNRNYGHALSGQRAELRDAVDPREGAKATLLLVRTDPPLRFPAPIRRSADTAATLTAVVLAMQAVDQNVGTVAEWVWFGNVNEGIFRIFLEYLVYPALRAQTPGVRRYLM